MGDDRVAELLAVELVDRGEPADVGDLDEDGAIGPFGQHGVERADEAAPVEQLRRRVAIGEEAVELERQLLGDVARPDGIDEVAVKSASCTTNAIPT